MTNAPNKLVYKGSWHFSISKDFVLDNSLSAESRLLFIILKSFTNDKTKIAFPSRIFLTKSMNCSNRSLSKYIDELIQSGYINKRKERSLNGTFKRNLYEITEKHHWQKMTPGKNENLTTGKNTVLVNSTTNIYQSNNERIVIDWSK
jgi:predicted transcriptional regulator